MLPIGKLCEIEGSINGPTPLTSISFSSELRLFVLAPHPDDFDEVAVTLKHFFDNGNDISHVVLTGAASGVLDTFVTPPTDQNKIEVREQEQNEALHFFGLPLTNVNFLRLPEADDGELLLDHACRDTVAELFSEFDPDIVSLPYGKDSNTGHQRTFALFRELATPTRKPLLALYHRDPKTLHIRMDTYVPFNSTQAEWKRKMLRYHRSQHTRNLRTRGYGFDDRILAFNEKIAAELPSDVFFAEGFQIELFLP